MKSYYQAIIIFIVFLSSAASLIFSGLSLTKAVSYQIAAAQLFFSELQKGDVVSASFALTSSVILNVILPLLPFMLLSAFGFVLVLYFKPRTKYLFASLTLVTVFAFLIKPSIAIVFACLGFFILIAPINFEEKQGFRNGYSFSSHMLRYFNLFVALGLFMALYINPNFEPFAKEQTVLLITEFMPNSTESAIVQKDIAKDFVTRAASGVSESINREYAKLNISDQCRDVKDAVDRGIENYKNSIISEIEKGDITSIDLEKQISDMEIFSSLAKSLPLITALMLLFVLEIMKPFVSLAAGLLYSVLEQEIKP